MSYRVIEKGEVESINAYVVDSIGSPLPGKTDLYVRVRRTNGDLLDWNDMSFKPSAWVLLDQSLAEADAIETPGIYELVGGFNSAAIAGLSETEDLLFIITQAPGVDAVLPNPVELQVRPGAGSLTPDNIASAVWEAQQSAYLTPGSMGASIARVLGLLHFNSMVDSQQYDVNGQLIAARLRVFDSVVNMPIAPGGSETVGLIQEYAIAAEYSGLNNLTNYTLKLVI